LLSLMNTKGVLTSYPTGHAALDVHNFGVPESNYNRLDMLESEYHNAVAHLLFCRAVDQVRIHLDLLADSISSVRTQHGSVHIRIQPDTVCSFRKCTAVHSVPRVHFHQDKELLK
ncbi:hypothetical protein T10_5228, partial [Trichinella papuae]